MTQNPQIDTPSWRKHWFVTNILLEIPFIRSFCKWYFKDLTLANAIYDAGKCAAGIAGGTIAMMPAHTEKDAMPIQALNMAGSMTAGMAAGKILYIAGGKGLSTLYDCFRSRSQPVQIADNAVAENESPPRTENISPNPSPRANNRPQSV